MTGHFVAVKQRHSLTLRNDRTEDALWRDDTALHAEVADDGRPFDPLSHALPAPPVDLRSVPVGGLGIKMMRSFADRMAYRRCGAINRLTLSFRIR